MQSLLPFLLLAVPLVARQPQHDNAHDADKVIVPRTVTLTSLKENYRPLLIFSASDDDPRLHQQVELKQDQQPGLTDRRIVLIPLYEHTPYTGGIAFFPDGQLGTVLKPEAAAIRRRFHIAPNDFTVILIGKDGGEKLRSHRPIPYETLRSTIDSMPMRQQEMKSKPNL